MAIYQNFDAQLEALRKGVPSAEVFADGVGGAAGMPNATSLGTDPLGTAGVAGIYKQWGIDPDRNYAQEQLANAFPNGDSGILTYDQQMANATKPGAIGTKGTTHLVLDPATGQYVPAPGTYGGAPASAGGGGIVAGGRSSAAPGLNYKPEKLGAPTSWNVSPDQTVEGRINSIINPDSPLMQKAGAQALDQAAGMGLSNSSMAVTAGQSAMLDAALPIASQDAQTFAKAAGYDADINNQFAVRNQDAVNQFNLSKMQFGVQWATAKLSADTQVNIAQMNNATQRDLATLNSDTQKLISGWDNESRMAVTRIQTENSTLLQTNSQAAQAFNTAMSAIDHIQNNPQMDAATKTQAIAQIWRDTQSQLKVLGAVAGLDLTSQLFMGRVGNTPPFPGFNDAGQWIGFPKDAQEATTPANGELSGSGDGGNGP